MLCVSNLKEFLSWTAATMSSLKHMSMHLFEESAALLWPMHQYLLGFDQCLADSFSQQVTMASAFPFLPEAVLTEVSCRT